MNAAAETVRKHYEPVTENGGIVSKITAFLESLPEDRISTAQLSGFDQFHIRGLEATKELAELAGVHKEMNVLEAGSGLGGPSRFLAETYGCSVLGVDLTPSFVEVSRLLSERTGLNALATYQVGDLLDLTFPNENFDLVWTQHVVMNISDRARLYREFRRVLKAGGKLAFYDVIAAGPNAQPHFPVPWADDGSSSFLLTQEQTTALLEHVGFRLQNWTDNTPKALAWFKQQPSQPPSGLSLGALIGPSTPIMLGNLARSFQEGRLQLAMGIFELNGDTKDPLERWNAPRVRSRSENPGAIL